MAECYERQMNQSRDVLETAVYTRFHVLRPGTCWNGVDVEMPTCPDSATVSLRSLDALAYLLTGVRG